MRYSLVLLVLLAACSKSPTAPARRGDPFTIVVTHAHFSDTLAQHYDLFVMVDEAGPTPPASSLQGSADSSQVANEFTHCSSIQLDSLGARTVWMEFRSSPPAATGDTVRSAVWDPANVPSADSAAGYGQTYDRPYYWHWYVSNDSSIVRGDTARFQITPDPATICRF